MVHDFRTLYNNVNNGILTVVSEVIAQEHKRGFCIGGGFKTVRLNYDGFSINVELIKDFKVVDTLSVHVHFSEVGISDRYWYSFRDYALENDAYLYVDAFDRVFSAHTKQVLPVSKCFKNEQPYVVGGFTFLAVKECFKTARNDKEIRYLLEELQPFGVAATNIKILNVTVSENEMLYEEGDDSVGLDFMVLTREALAEEDVKPSHFQFHVDLSGQKETLHLGCPDSVLAVEPSLIRASVEIYANVLKTFLETQQHPSLRLNNVQVVFTDTNSPKSMENALKELLQGFIREGHTDMPRRLERVKKCLPYLNKQNIKPSLNINNTPVFVFPRMQDTTAYVTVIGVVLLKDKTLEVVASYSILEGGSLEGYTHVLKRLGLSKMNILVDCMHLVKALPDFDKMLQS